MSGGPRSLVMSRLFGSVPGRRPLIPAVPRFIDHADLTLGVPGITYTSAIPAASRLFDHAASLAACPSRTPGSAHSKHHSPAVHHTRPVVRRYSLNLPERIPDGQAAAPCSCFWLEFHSTHPPVSDNATGSRNYWRRLRRHSHHTFSRYCAPPWAVNQSHRFWVPGPPWLQKHGPRSGGGESGPESEEHMQSGLRLPWKT
ncbi:hypothetical protein EJ06DRAFT_521576 [Trichodelitschia bisporula]|uniref:Uncharacterized protein n=1 Tax=Trichodelitschia bisporula TaxID=703511 RepID=A0A6G1HYC4_9PEZI|nr:hypothetical protein EJ06DRAFT_521576 [Trichodelitschia bisporula]